MKLKTFFTDHYDMSKERLAICEACEFYNRTTSQCNQCGCFMKAKTLLMGSECPEGKWAKVDEFK